jgi:hypothetical protein
MDLGNGRQYLPRPKGYRLRKAFVHGWTEVW